MVTPFKVIIDGVDRSSHVDPSTISITRALEQRANTAEFFASREGAAVTYYQDPTTLPGIIAWWHMDEESGDLADASGNGHTLLEQATLFPTQYRRSPLARGYGGWALRWTAELNQYFVVNAEADFDLTGDLSIFFWYKMPSGYGTNRPVISFGTSTNNWLLRFSAPGSVQWRTESGGAVSTTTLTGGPDDGRAHHLVLTRASDGTLKLYIDGELIDTDTSVINGSAGASQLRVGRSDLTGSEQYYFDKLDELGVSDEVLTADEVALLYAQGRQAFEQLQLEDLSEVVITNDDDEPRFGGYIVRAEPVRDDGLVLGWNAKAVGWEHRFKSVVVSYAAFNKRTDEVIAEIFAATPELAGYSLSRVRQGRTLASYIKQDAYVDEILDELAAIDSYQWYITPDGSQLVYRRLTMDVTAPWYLSDVPGDVADGAVAAVAFSLDSDMFEPVSRVIVRGASDLEAWNPKGFPNLNGNGPLDIIGPGLLPPDGQDYIRVQFNEASGGSPVWGADLAVGLEDKDTLITELSTTGLDTTQINGLQNFTAATTTVTVDSTTLFPSAGFFQVSGDSAPFQYTSKNATQFLGVTSHFRGNLIDNAVVYDVSHGKQVLYSPSKGRLRWDAYVRPPNITAYDTAFRVYAQKRISIRVEMFDEPAKKRLGGEYTKRIIDDTLTSRGDATARAQRALKEGQRPRVTVRAVVEVDVDTAEYKLQPGHLLHVRNTFRGLDTYSERDEGSDGLQVQQITSYGDLGGSKQYHELLLGTWPKDELDWAMEIRRRLDRVQIRDFWDDFEPVVVIKTGWGGDPSDTEGALKFSTPTVTIEP